MIQDEIVLQEGVAARRKDQLAQAVAIAFVGSKIGVGATTLAANLAVSLSQRNKRVVLMDLCSSPGSATELLGLKRSYVTPGSTQQQPDASDLQRAQTMLSTRHSGLKVLAGLQATEATSDNVESLFTDLNGTADFILLDTEAGASATAAAALSRCHLVLVVTGSGPDGLTGARSTADFLMEQMGIDQQRLGIVVIDRDGFLTDAEFTRIKPIVESSTHINLLAIVPHELTASSRLTDAAQASGEPDRPFALRLTQLVDWVTSQNIATLTPLRQAAVKKAKGKPDSTPKRIDLKQCKVQQKALSLVPEQIARKHNLIPLAVIEGSLVVVMANPDDIQAIEDIAALTKMRIEPAAADLADIQHFINLSYKASAEIEKQITQILPRTPVHEEAGDALAKRIAETPVVRVLDLLIKQAVKDRASDIHIEPQQDKLRIRYRIDGILHNAVSLDPSVHNPLLSRIKILANMNIAEQRRPQDGQFSVKADDKDIDIRVATCQTTFGELAVLRILDKSAALFTLSQLGFLPEALKKYRQTLKSTYGMILVSGPTGSGKTTTLYASINQLDRNESNIMTIEDPVEYRFLDISQIQVNPKAGITFAAGLRAIMRLDPDVILVGEIRDSETAKIAVQSALTGHLVLSSIHANDTVGALSRLLDLGIEPYLVTSALIGVIAQRMVRRICPHCRASYEPSLEERIIYDEEMGQAETTFYRGTGCNFCSGTGYLGRIGVYEIMTLSNETRKLLLTNINADAIKSQVLKEGMITMRHDGMLKVRDGITDIHEVMRNVFSIG